MSFFAQYADDAHRCALMRIRCASADASAWPTLVPIGSLFHKKLGPYWVPISKLGGAYKFI